MSQYSDYDEYDNFGLGEDDAWDQDSEDDSRAYDWLVAQKGSDIFELTHHGVESASDDDQFVPDSTADAPISVTAAIAAMAGAGTRTMPGTSMQTPTKTYKKYSPDTRSSLIEFALAHPTTPVTHAAKCFDVNPRTAQTWVAAAKKELNNAKNDQNDKIKIKAPVAKAKDTLKLVPRNNNDDYEDDQSVPTFTTATKTKEAEPPVAKDRETTTRRKYSAETRRELVDYVLTHPETPIVHTAKRLNVVPSTAYGWVAAAKKERASAIGITSTRSKKAQVTAHDEQAPKKVTKAEPPKQKQESAAPSKQEPKKRGGRKPVLNDEHAEYFTRLFEKYPSMSKKEAVDRFFIRYDELDLKPDTVKRFITNKLGIRTINFWVHEDEDIDELIRKNPELLYGKKK